MNQIYFLLTGVTVTLAELVVSKRFHLIQIATATESLALLNTSLCTPSASITNSPALTATITSQSTTPTFNPVIKLLNVY